MRSLWPWEWRPDRGTVGLLMAGVFGIATVGFALQAGAVLYEAMNGLAPGLPSGLPNGLGLSNLYLSTAERIAEATTFVRGVALGVVAISGIAMVAQVRWAVQVAVIGLSFAAVALLIDIVAVSVSGSTLLGPAAAQTLIPPALTVLGYVALILILVGKAPGRRARDSRHGGALVDGGRRRRGPGSS